MNTEPWQQILALFEARGHERYDGEPVTHLQHALQCGALAVSDGHSDALVTAALLHDIGHLLNDPEPPPPTGMSADHHERRAARWLRQWFGPAVTGPVALHVAAKRFLCARGGFGLTATEYLESLSDDSRRSLVVQGGPMSRAETRSFAKRRWSADALLVRGWDDLAKFPDPLDLRLDHFEPAVRGCLRSVAIEPSRNEPHNTAERHPVGTRRRFSA